MTPVGVNGVFCASNRGSWSGPTTKTELKLVLESFEVQVRPPSILVLPRGPGRHDAESGSDEEIADPILRNTERRGVQPPDFRAVAAPLFEHLRRSFEKREVLTLHRLHPRDVFHQEQPGFQFERRRATLAGNLCNASPAADSVPAMIAASVTCLVVGPSGQREVPVESICTGPGETSLAKGEFIVAFKLPPRPPRSGDAYLRFIPRAEMDTAVVGCAVNVTVDETRRCADARVVLGAVAPIAVLVPDTTKALVGRQLNDSTLQALDDAARQMCRPIVDKRGTIEYRTKIAGVLARRTAAIAFARAGSAQ